MLGERDENEQAVVREAGESNGQGIQPMYAVYFKKLLWNPLFYAICIN